MTSASRTAPTEAGSANGPAAANGGTPVFAPQESAQPVLERWQRDLREGRDWADALLDAVGAWPLAAERRQGRDFVYLLGGEAFDWLALAERLLLKADGAAPVEEQERLLFEGTLPERVTAQRFKEALGVSRYRAHLNYFYGVVVEEALWQAAEADALKQRGVRGVQHQHGLDDSVSERLYGVSFGDLVRAHYREQGRRPRVRHSLSEWKAFAYWRFKLRLSLHDRARVASDTQRGLALLEALGCPRAARPSISLRANGG